jgi:hypothetical protein
MSIVIKTKIFARMRFFNVAFRSREYRQAEAGCDGPNTLIKAALINGEVW